MPSTIAWLDTSSEDQRCMREVVNLFTQTESRDELGIGQVRDAFSDLLFPGTSTLHTRARYLLLVPWCYRAAAKLARDGADLERRAEENERRLIAALRDAGLKQGQGLIGAQASTKLKTLPSALYRSALTQYGILVGDSVDELARRTWSPETDEVVERKPQMWDTLPVPDGFPATADTLDLSHDEAVWLRERLLRGCRGSLLEVLLLAQDGVTLQLPRAWNVPTAERDLSALREHARLFSLCLHGAALTYNAILADRYQAAGLDGETGLVERYDELTREWHEGLADDQQALAAWDLQDLWIRVRAKNPRIGRPAQHFVEQWVDLVRTGASPNDVRCRTLVADRERAVKRGQSRLTNDKLLRAWSGASATRPLVYRWGNVQQLVTDIHEGLARAAT